MIPNPGQAHRLRVLELTRKGPYEVILSTSMTMKEATITPRIDQTQVKKAEAADAAAKETLSQTVLGSSAPCPLPSPDSSVGMNAGSWARAHLPQVQTWELRDTDPGKVRARAEQRPQPA